MGLGVARWLPGGSQVARRCQELDGGGLGWPGGCQEAARWPGGARSWKEGAWGHWGHQEANGGTLGWPGGCQGARGVQESKGGGLSGQEARPGGHGVKEWPRS